MPLDIKHMKGLARMHSSAPLMPGMTYRYVYNEPVIMVMCSCYISVFYDEYFYGERKMNERECWICI